MNVYLKNEEISYKKHNRRFFPHTYHYGYFRYDVCKKETILEERNRSSRPDVRKKRCSGNMQQIHRRTTMPKCDFSKVAKQLY